MREIKSSKRNRYGVNRLLNSSLSTAQAIVGLPNVLSLPELHDRSKEGPAHSSSVSAFNAPRQPSPIETIPVELLQVILWELVKRISYYSNRGYFAEITWVRLVCRRWTNVLDGMPEVWTKLSTTINENLANKLLLKSMELPLTIVGRLSSSRTMDKLLQHIHRWETLEVSEADEKTVAQLRRHTAPALNALKLSSTSAVFLELSLDSFAPNVRAVHIRDSGLRWKTSNLSGLQELSLLDIASGMPDVDTLIDILSQSPELTRLRVEQTMLRRTQRQARNPITLSHLRTLSLGHLGRDVIAQLLKSIVIPSTTECHFSISLNDYEDTSVWEQVDPIGQRFLALAAVSRGIQSTLRFSKEHAGWALGLVYEGKAEGHGRLSAEVEVLAGNTLGMAELFAQQISQGEPNPCPPVLRVVDLISDLELLPRLHGHLPHTEEIHIEDDNPHLVTRALDAIFTPHPSSRLFPSLSTLTIQNPRPNEWADWLIKRQKRQYKRGGVDPLPLATLKIQGGNLTAENMKWMRKLVGNVGVDNEQMP